jgi:hypothetical protein
MDAPRLRAAAASALALIAAPSTWRTAGAGLARGARVGVGGVRTLVGWWRRRPGGRARELRRLSSMPLPNLYELHPDARRATPREIGLRSIDLTDVAGTAVGGLTQRGSDFKPLPAFRSQNWQARWDRVRRANEQLAILPPIDVVRYPPGGKYWISDGHNRMAAALEFGQVEIDANVTELVPPGQNPTERPGNLAAALAGTRSLRAAGQGGRLETVPDDVILGVPGRDGGAPPSVHPAPPPAPPPPVADPARSPTQPAAPGEVPPVEPAEPAKEP